MELSEFYKDVENGRQLLNEEPPELRIDQYREEMKGKGNSAKGLMYVGEKQNDIAKELGKVEQMLRDVISGVTGALSSLVDKFAGNGYGVCSFKMPADRVGRDGSLLDEFGNPIDKYGVKEIISEEYRKRIQRDFEIAAIYLPWIRLQEMQTADRKTLALVTGVDSAEFNAVVKAHREKERLSKELQLLGKEKNGLMQNMGLSTGLQVTSDGNRAVDNVAVTPVVAGREAQRSH